MRTSRPKEVRREEPGAAPKTAGHGTCFPCCIRGRRGEGDYCEDEGCGKIAGEHAPVRLTHPQKILDARSHLTKQQLADYYWAVASHMLPHVEGRPVSLVRCPDGSEKPCFYQKHVNHMLPPGIGPVDVPDKKTGEIEPYITLSNAEALAGLAQMGVLEVHPWGSRNDDLEHPDRIIIRSRSRSGDRVGAAGRERGRCPQTAQEDGVGELSEEYGR